MPVPGQFGAAHRAGIGADVFRAPHPCYSASQQNCDRASSQRVAVAIRGDLMTISRRNFARIGAAGAAVAVASPAIAQSTPTLKWRMTSSFPKSLEGLWGASPTVAKLVSEMSDGKFEIQPFGPGEIVPGLQVMDAVANGTVECGHTYSGYYVGKNTTVIFDGSLPFGMTARQQNAWYLFGDGK